MEYIKLDRRLNWYHETVAAEMDGVQKEAIRRNETVFQVLCSVNCGQRPQRITRHQLCRRQHQQQLLDATYQQVCSLDQCCNEAAACTQHILSILISANKYTDQIVYLRQSTATMKCVRHSSSIRLNLSQLNEIYTWYKVNEFTHIQRVMATPILNECYSWGLNWDDARFPRWHLLLEVKSILKTLRKFLQQRDSHTKHLLIVRN